MTTCEICKSPTPAEPTLGVTMCDDCYFGRSIDFSFAAQWADTRKTYAHRRRAQFREPTWNDYEVWWWRQRRIIAGTLHNRWMMRRSTASNVSH